MKEARAQDFVVVLENVKLRYFLELHNFNCFFILWITWFSYENFSNLQCFKHLGFFILYLLYKQVYRLKYCFSNYSIFVKNYQLKILNRMTYSITIFGNFNFFPTAWMVEYMPFRNHPLLRKSPWPVKST